MPREPVDLCHHLRDVVRCVGRRRPVTSGTELPALRAHEDRPDGRVGVRTLQGGEDLGPAAVRAEAEDVKLVGPVEADVSDPILDVICDMGVAGVALRD